MSTKHTKTDRAKPQRNMYRLKIYSLPSREARTGRLRFTYDISSEAGGNILQYVATEAFENKALPVPLPTTKANRKTP